MTNVIRRGSDEGGSLSGMSLRARLIWAFFLLAVVPLCGITLYSYLSTESAYR